MTLPGRCRRADGAARCLTAFLLMAAAPTRAEGPVSAQVPAVEGALHATPAPAGAETEKPPSQQPRTAPALPAAAQSGAWRTGAHPPADVPAEAVLRAAGRKPSDAREAPPVVEIIWHAPGS